MPARYKDPRDEYVRSVKRIGLRPLARKWRQEGFNLRRLQRLSVDEGWVGQRKLFRQQRAVEGDKAIVRIQAKGDVDIAREHEQGWDEFRALARVALREAVRRDPDSGALGLRDLSEMPLVESAARTYQRATEGIRLARGMHQRHEKVTQEENGELPAALRALEDGRLKSLKASVLRQLEAIVQEDED